MLYLILKAGLSGVIVAIVSEIAKRNPGFGGLIASLPLVSILGMVWLWSDTRDPVRLASHAGATFWFVLPSLPMFLLMPELLKRGVGFWPALMAACALAIALYSLMIWVGPNGAAALACAAVRARVLGRRCGEARGEARRMCFRRKRKPKMSRTRRLEAGRTGVVRGAPM